MPVCFVGVYCFRLFWLVVLVVVASVLLFVVLLLLICVLRWVALLLRCLGCFDSWLVVWLCFLLRLFALLFVLMVITVVGFACGC